MATEKKLKQLARQLLIPMICTGVFVGFATFWTARSAFRTSIAMLTLNINRLLEEEQSGNLSPLSLRQRIQMHFLSKDVYLPLEDIIFVQQDVDPNERPIFLMRNACGEGKLYIWIPLIFRLPLYGNSVWEFCWTPA